MCKWILAVASIALTVSMMTLVTPAQAEQRIGWCSRQGGQLHCMYHSHAQCRASVSGGRGTCVRNPHG